jgi:N-methylhydantoinase B/oxoprolinase/acetone carboxylase alpha subunit
MLDNFKGKTVFCRVQLGELWGQCSEVLEWRFPALLENFCIRPNSGGKGFHRGGNGVIRRLRFLEAMTAAIFALD